MGGAAFVSGMHAAMVVAAAALGGAPLRPPCSCEAAVRSRRSHHCRGSDAEIATDAES